MTAPYCRAADRGQEAGITCPDLSALVSRKHSSSYAIFARAMIVAGVVGALLLLAERLLPAATREGLHTLFWVEVVVALLFILFWLFQTADLHTRRA